MPETIDKAHAVMTSMAAGMTAKQAAAEHDCTESWADNLLNKAPAYVRDAPWYRGLKAKARVHRDERAGMRVTPKRKAM